MHFKQSKRQEKKLVLVLNNQRNLDTIPLFSCMVSLRLKIRSVFHANEMLNDASLVLIVELKIHHLSSPINKTNAAIVWSESEGKSG